MLTRSLDPNDANADCKQKQKSKEMKLSKMNQIILEKQSQI